MSEDDEFGARPAEAISAIAILLLALAFGIWTDCRPKPVRCVSYEAQPCDEMVCVERGGEFCGRYRHDTSCNVCIRWSTP